MSFFLIYTEDSSLPPQGFREKVVFPLGNALKREGLGSVVDNDPEDEGGGEGK
jgi:hypothetical protein